MDAVSLSGLAAVHLHSAAMAEPAAAGALIGALFLAGLAGGAAHCAGMCGPFVLAQTAGRLAAVPVERFGRLTRLGGALLLPYHLGRATTYAGLGAVGAALAGGIAALPAMGWIRTALLTLAALLMIAAALEKSGFSMPRPGAALLGRWAGRMARPLLARPGGSLHGFALGAALGFLPCGFLYGALAAAAASGQPLVGAAAMAAFALGTAPSLFAVALLGEAAGRTWRRSAGRLAPFAFAANAGLLFWTAWA
jgi:sulfite exporter TauE/SafE